MPCLRYSLELLGVCNLLFFLFLSGILQYSYAKGCGRFLEQPLFYLDKGKGNDKMNVRIIILVRFRNSKIRELFHSIFLF